MTGLLILLCLTALLLGLLLFAYLYLVWTKTSDRRRANKKNLWLQKRSWMIEKFLFTGKGASAIAPVKGYQYEALEDALSGCLANYKFETDGDWVRDFVNRYFVPRYKRRLRYGRWSQRMNALYFIDLFGIESMREELLRHLSGKRTTPEERFEIFLLLAKFGYRNLLERTGDLKKMPAFLLAVLVGRLMNQDNVDEFMDRFDRFDRVVQEAILEVVRDQNLRSDKLQDRLEELMDSEDRELRVKSLKTIAVLGYVSSIERVVRMLDRRMNSKEWDKPDAAGEKLMAARVMGSIRNERFIPFLTRLIGDAAYNVRSEAARSIRQYRGGTDVLRKLADSHADPYARSIAQEWIERSPEYD